MYWDPSSIITHFLRCVGCNLLFSNSVFLSLKLADNQHKLNSNIRKLFMLVTIVTRAYEVIIFSKSSARFEAFWSCVWQLSWLLTWQNLCIVDDANVNFASPPSQRLFWKATTWTKHCQPLIWPIQKRVTHLRPAQVLCQPNRTLYEFFCA